MGEQLDRKKEQMDELTVQAERATEFATEFVTKKVSPGIQKLMSMFEHLVVS